MRLTLKVQPVFIASFISGGGHPNPLLHVYAFARLGMRFSRKRSLAALLLTALICLAGSCCGGLPVIW